MTKVKCRRKHENQIPNVRHSCFIILSPFDFRHSTFPAECRVPTPHSLPRSIPDLRHGPDAPGQSADDAAHAGNGDGADASPRPARGSHLTNSDAAVLGPADSAA